MPERHPRYQSTVADQTNITLERLEGFVRGFWWILPNLGIALGVFLVFLLAAWGVRAAVLGAFRRSGRPDLAELLGGFARWCILALGLLSVTAIVFPSVRPVDVLATLGIGSLAVGFAFKEILQNWLAGLLILLRQPFRQQDEIIVGEHEGTVERIAPRATSIRTYDGRRVLIPNSDVYTRAVVVNTAFDRRRSSYDIGIGYGDDVEVARSAILRALEAVDEIQSSPAPQVNAWELSRSTVNLRTFWWTAPQQGVIVETRGRVIAAIKGALSEAGVDLPFPTRVVLFHDQTDEADGDRRRQREGWPAGVNPPAPRHLNRVVLDEVRQRQGSNDDAAGSRCTRPDVP